jgi:putative transposase
MPKYRKPPSQTWKAFWNNHVQGLASGDFFTVPTASFRVLFVFVVLAHHRRHVVHFNVTEHPAAAWTAQQILEAFPEDTAPRYLIRDRDQIYGECFRHGLRDMGTTEVLTAPQSPWQNPFSERLVGSIRREWGTGRYSKGRRMCRTRQQSASTDVAKQNASSLARTGVGMKQAVRARGGALLR